MAGQGGLDGDLRCFQVPDFSNHNHIGVLPENGPETGGESNSCLKIDLSLTDQVQPIFNRVFDGDDVLIHGIDHVQRTIERGGLTASGGSCDQDDSVGFSKELFVQGVHICCESEFLQFDQWAALIQDPKDYVFSIDDGEGGNTDLKIPVFHLHIEVS